MKTKRKSEGQTPFTFWIPIDIHRKIKQEALTEGTTARAVIVRVLKAYLEAQA